jgi:hypothetical protein
MKYQIEEHPNFINHKVNKFFPCSHQKIEIVFDNLQKRETFVQGQILPYKVEFDSELQTGTFKEGELNIHHGPLLSVHGIIGEISENYRDLKYFYGSYILSFRLVRPVRLEFFKEEKGIRLKVTCLVKPWFVKPWEILNNIFWKFFGISFLF